MSILWNLRHLIPRAIRHRALALMDREIPPTFRLPYYYYSYKFRSALEPEMSLLPKLVVSGTNVVDIGANFGLYSYVLGKLAHVFAFEPNPQCRSILEAYRSRNIEIFPYALGSVHASGTLHIPIVNGHAHSGFATMNAVQGHHALVDVEVRTLDEFGFANVSFMKIDVEGYEVQVLDGAQHLLESCRPTLLVEIEQRHLSCQIGSVFSKILEHGYSGYFLYKGKVFPLSAFSVERHQLAPLHQGTLTDYVNNFVFLHAGGTISSSTLSI